MAQQFKHNRKRNAGLVYEFLVRRLSQSMVERDRGAYQKTMEILRKYYGEGMILAEERELFDVIKNTRGVSESAARRILGEVQRQANKMDAKKLDIKKSNVIKEINYAFGKDFFAQYRIPEYRLLASIQMVLDASRGEPLLTESVAKIQLEEGLVQYMTTKGGTVKQTSRSEVDQLVMRMVAKRFEEKYSKSLNGAQKKLLERYIRFQVTGDAGPLEKFIQEETKRVSEAIFQAQRLPDVREDKVMMGRLDEAAGHIIKLGSVEERVEHIMLYQKLAEEIDADE